MRYLIAYDISENNLRQRFSKHLRQIGMKRVQKSVFVGKVKKRERNDLYQQLLLKINTATDRILLLPISIDNAKAIQLHRTINNIDTLTQNIGIQFF